MRIARNIFRDVNCNIIGLIIGSLPLCAAYVAQYLFSIPPCKLCLYQRLPYWIIVVASVIAIGLKYRGYRAVLLLSLLSSIGISLFHLGVENRWIAFGSTCVFDRSAIESFEQYEMMVSQADLVPCDVVAIAFLGLSMAGWNLIYGLLCATLIYFKSLKY